MAMLLVHTVAEVRAAHDAVRATGGKVGLVPTMGYLHAGHGSLIEAAAAQCEAVTTTIFVNPLQFGANEDLSSYPRDLEGDLALAEAAGATLVFAPSVQEMYPGGTPPLTSVHVGTLGELWEGATRPTHFHGVTTVVAKLFSIAGPSRAYFGEKDFQQLRIVRRMAADLNLAVDVIGCPIVREQDGLAMSSRNVYLSDSERQAALVLSRALSAGAAAIEAGARSSSAVNEAMAAVVRDEPLAHLDYAATIDIDTVQPAPERLVPGEYRVIIAAQVGRPRLIDNAPLIIPRES